MAAELQRKMRVYKRLANISFLIKRRSGVSKGTVIRAVRALFIPLPPSSPINIRLFHHRTPFNICH